MITIVHEEQGGLRFLFEVPMPAQAAAHPEMIRFEQDFCRKGGRALRDDEGCVGGLSIDPTGWQDFLSANLPASTAARRLEFLDELTLPNALPNADGLEVNFHQKPFDTALRYWLFILRQGHFTDYFINRVEWFTAPLRGKISAFPLHVDLESASTCNMDCPMCYRRGLDKTGQMDFELFTRAIDECAENEVFSVRLSWRGETLTHPHIREMIDYACKRIKNVSFLTNAFYVDEDMARAFIDSGVSYVAVSFDGIGKVYEKVRAPAKFEENRARLARLRELREAAGASRPQVRLCTIWPAISHDPEGYQEAMRPVSDYMVYNPYINFAGPMRIKPDFVCQYPWERLVVGFDGDTQCCTGWNATDIVLGNLAETSLARMWQSPLMERIRETHAAGRRMELASCAACRHGSKGDESVTIDEILERRW